MTTPRLDAITGRKVRTFECLECGASFDSTATYVEFCCEAHRKAWNNRRAMRGAEIYDLLMAVRYDRHRATHLKLWTLLCRMAALCRAADFSERQGRRSWSPPEQVIDRKPYLLAVVVHRGRA
jgi:hypothetical protein